MPHGAKAKMAYARSCSKHAKLAAISRNHEVKQSSGHDETLLFRPRLIVERDFIQQEHFIHGNVELSWTLE
jgi:hypothetical protein